MSFEKKMKSLSRLVKSCVSYGQQYIMVIISNLCTRIRPLFLSANAWLGTTSRVPPLKTW